MKLNLKDILMPAVALFVICLVAALRSRTIPLNIPCLLRPGTAMVRRFVRYASPVIVNEILWGAGNSMMTVILGHTHNSVEMLAANAVTGNLSRLFLVVCFGLGAATAVIGGKAIGKFFGMNYSEDIIFVIAKLVKFLPIKTGKK